MYCTQTAARRSAGLTPICKTVCWRRLFPQDYVSEDEAEQYPADTQTGTADQEATSIEEKPGVMGFNGRYVYFARSDFRMQGHVHSMNQLGLKVDTPIDKLVVPAKDPETMQFLERYHYSILFNVGALPLELWDAVKDRTSKVMAPSQRYIHSFQPGGTQEQFASRLWEKTRNGESLEVARKVLAKMWESISNAGKDE